MEHSLKQLAQKHHATSPAFYGLLDAYFAYFSVRQYHVKFVLLGGQKLDAELTLWADYFPLSRVLAWSPDEAPIQTERTARQPVLEALQGAPHWDLITVQSGFAEFESLAQLWPRLVPEGVLAFENPDENALRWLKRQQDQLQTHSQIKAMFWYPQGVLVTKA